MTDQPNNLFKNLPAANAIPASGNGPAADAELKADFAIQAADSKEVQVAQKLGANETEINATLDSTEQNVVQLEEGSGTLDLMEILVGYADVFDQKALRTAKATIPAKSAMTLTSGSAATYGTVPDNIVKMAVDSTFSRSSGKARMEVAEVLDTATGVADKIRGDGTIQAENIKKQAENIYAHWSNAKMVAVLFAGLYDKVLNRVASHQGRLLDVYEDLGSKMTLLDGIAASLLARQQMVINDLMNTCVNGVALDAIIKTAQKELNRLEKQRDAATSPALRSALEGQVTRQESLVQILIRRSIDLKSFAIKELGLITIIGKIYDSVNVVRADVEFTRTNLIFTLGLTLGLIVDVVATIRIGESARKVREAEAEATEKLGMASDALNELATKVLTDIDITMRSVESTIGAAIRAVNNTHENMGKMLEIQQSSGTRLNALLSSLGNA